MRRKDLAFGGTLVGALLLVAGVLDFVASWIFPVAGVLVFLAGIAAAGARGAIALAVLGGWLFLSSFLEWATGQWNLLASGLVVTALGFLTGAAGSPPQEYTEPEGTG